MSTLRRRYPLLAYVAAVGLLSFYPKAMAFAYGYPDWSKGAPVSPTGESNRYGLADSDLAQSIHDGKIHTQIYPVEVTGMLPPYAPFEHAANDTSANPLARILEIVMGDLTGIKSVDSVMAWVGLHPYPKETDQGVFSAPYPAGVRPGYRMGFGKIETPLGTGFSFSCAACHSANLFGKTVLGLTNRFPHANDVFLAAKEGAPLVSPELLAFFGGATPGEVELYKKLREHIPFVGVKKPLVLGLDTSLAQVALSLARRSPDGYATQDPKMAAHPRPDLLEHFPADSKPAVWWNLKYKNRWLSDGSVVSGNPIYTNILWNEIGRGIDLQILEGWLQKNENVIRDLTSAVFSMEAPRITDFFPAEKIDLARAQHGEMLFNDRCAGCHGHYDKTWSIAGSSLLSLSEQIKTYQVRYHDQTPVKDVGTDPNRYLGMKSLETALNPLTISVQNGIVIESQKGYVPPPLVGIWARWPYFHNGSIPSLCALLTQASDRPSRFQEVEADDRERDFDFECNGYPAQPLGKVRSEYDTSREGMHNSGHDQGIFIKNGVEIFSQEDKRDLIQFMQTL